MPEQIKENFVVKLCGTCRDKNKCCHSEIGGTCNGWQPKKDKTDE